MKTNPFKVGDRVKLHPEALKHHARSVPAHLGYTHEGFLWRDTMRKLSTRVGVIERTFPNSNHVNVQFDEDLIGIDTKSLVKAE